MSPGPPLFANAHAERKDVTSKPGVNLLTNLIIPIPSNVFYLVSVIFLWEQRSEIGK